MRRNRAGLFSHIFTALAAETAIAGHITLVSQSSAPPMPANSGRRHPHCGSRPARQASMFSAKSDAATAFSCSAKGFMEDVWNIAHGSHETSFQPFRLAPMTSSKPVRGTA